MIKKILETELKEVHIKYNKNEEYTLGCGGLIIGGGSCGISKGTSTKSK